MYLDSIVPFYVAYPNYRMFSDEYRRMQDLEYLQAMYPMKVKEYQRKINQVLDRIDYAGSMIYDEFPDRISLYKLATDITESIIRDDKENDKMNNEAIQLQMEYVKVAEGLGFSSNEVTNELRVHWRQGGARIVAKEPIHL